jgi:hypothetical protein
MKFALTIFALFSQIAFSQQAANPPANVTRVVRIRHAIPQKIAELLVPGSPVMINADNLLKVVVLRGNPNNIASVEQTIHELDIPGTAPTPYKSRDVEVVVSVIGGFDDAELLPGGQVSEAMAPVVKQLRAVFPYKNYQLLSSMLLRSSEGAKAGNNGVMKSLGKSGAAPRANGYGVGYDEANVSSEEGKPIIHLRHFSFRTAVATQYGSSNTTQWVSNDVSIQTDIDLREGQKVVAGKANVDNSDLALFVVLTARVVE